MSITNQQILSRDFLRGMYNDSYFPDFLVDQVKHILLDVCQQIEDNSPESADALFSITHPAVERINALEPAFEENGSELETEAREVMGADFEFIIKAYGFKDIDIEDVIAPREW